MNIDNSIFKVTEIFSDGWDLSHSWLVLPVGGTKYFPSYEAAEKYRDEHEDEFTKFAITKIFLYES